MKVVIMAGGKGTRISSVASDIPKPMIKIEGIPVLEREIECLKEQGFDEILITVSHLGNIIMDYFGDGSGNSPVTGQPFGVHAELGVVLAENLQGALPAIALDGHPALSTAYMNDCEPLLCFAQQVNTNGQ